MFTALRRLKCKLFRHNHRWVTIRRFIPSSDVLVGKATEDRRTMWLLEGLDTEWEITSDSRLANGMICYWCREKWLWDEPTIEDYKNWLLDN
jgi:hypothetical protein